MAEPERIEALVLGSGEGGKYLACHLARSGRRTVVVERRWIGGSCPNINCLPSKNEIWSAKVADLARRAGEFGVMTRPITIDMARVRQRKRDMVDALITVHLQNYKASGAELIMGSGRFVAPRTLEVQLNDGGTQLLAGDQVFINIGTSPAIPDVPGLATTQPLTNIEALDLDYLPSHLIVLGGGSVGLELVQAIAASENNLSDRERSNGLDLNGSARRTRRLQSSFLPMEQHRPVPEPPSKPGDSAMLPFIARTRSAQRTMKCGAHGHRHRYLIVGPAISEEAR